MKKLILIMCLFLSVNMPFFAYGNQELDYQKEYKKATTQNDAEAQFRIGYMYEKGIEVEQSYTKAVQWYEKAVKQNNENASVYLGSLYLNGLGVDQDLNKAKKLIEKGALNGNSSGEFYMGLFYEIMARNSQVKGIEANLNNDEINKNYVMARKWYEKALKHGEPAAAGNLGVFYQDGKGVKPDEVKARKYYEQGAKGNAIVSKNNLANLY